MAPKRRPPKGWRRDFARGRRAVTLYVSALIAVTLVGWASMAIYQMYFNPNRNAQRGDQVVQEISPQARVAAVGEVLDCLAAGDACSRFDDARTVFGQMVQGDQLSYTPTTDADPGQRESDGAKTVRVSTLSDGELQQVAVASLWGDRSNSDAITVESVVVSGDGLAGSYALPATATAPAAQGTMTFTSPSGGSSSGDEKLVAITYVVRG